MSATPSASNWAPIPEHPEAYIDMSSVRLDTFPKVTLGGVTNLVNGHFPTATYRVAWLATVDGDKNFTAKVEVVFDCNGKMGMLQQIIMNETKDSVWHSFDNTQSFLAAGVALRSIAPDSFYDSAQGLVCAPKKK